MMLSMRSSLLKIGALVIVAVCLGGHVSELFDRWEKAAISGDDIDYTFVLVAAIAGAVLTLAKAAKKLFAHAAESIPNWLTSLETIQLSAVTVTSATHSPPLLLRI